MKALRLTKAERALLTEVLTGRTGRDARVAAGLLEKIEKAELVKGAGVAPGVGVEPAIVAMREVLGDRLALPPSPDKGWFAKLGNVIRSKGLTLGDCRTIAKAWEAKRFRQLTVSFETLVYRAETFLADAQLPLPTATTKPTTMEDY